jgi:hypothetical protein
VKATASARTAASTKSGIGKASAKTAIADKKKKKAPEATPEAEAPPPVTEQVTIEVTISEPSEEKKKEESPPVVVESSALTSVDATPVADEAFTTPSTAEQVEQTETSLSEALAEKLPRLSAALTGEGEEGTSVDKVDSDNLEEREAKELETEEAKEADDERAERRKVSINVIQKPCLLLNSAQTYLMI